MILRLTEITEGTEKVTGGKKVMRMRIFCRVHLLGGKRNDASSHQCIFTVSGLKLWIRINRFKLLWCFKLYFDHSFNILNTLSFFYFAIKDLYFRYIVYKCKQISCEIKSSAWAGIATAKNTTATSSLSSTHDELRTHNKQKYT